MGSWELVQPARGAMGPWGRCGGRQTRPQQGGRSCIALLQLFGFPQCKHCFLDMLNTHHLSHTPVFAFLLLQESSPPPELVLWAVDGQLPQTAVARQGCGLWEAEQRHSTSPVVAESSSGRVQWGAAPQAARDPRDALETWPCASWWEQRVSPPSGGMALRE